MSNETDSAVIDKGVENVRMIVTIPTDNMTVGPSGMRSVHIPVDHITQAAGVKTAAQLNFNRMQIGEPILPQGTSGTFGFTFDHGDDIPLNTPERTVRILKGNTDAYHFVHTSKNSFGGASLPIQATAASLQALKNDPGVHYKRVLRWRADPAQTNADFYNLMTPANVNAGVTRSVMNDDRKMIVLPTDTQGNMNAVSQLVRRNGDDPTFFGGKYSSDKITRVTFNGQEGFVMPEEDFNAIAEPLRQSLDHEAHDPFVHGLNVNAISLESGFQGDSIQLPLTFQRTVPKLHEDFDKSFVTLNDVAAAFSEESGARAGSTSAIGSLAEVVHAVEAGEPTLESLE
jgi:hypothetical protein